MVARAVKVVVGLAALAVVGVVGATLLSPANASSEGSATGNPLTDAASQATTAATNAAIDASGVKTAVKDALLSHAGDISSVTGLATSQVQAAIEGLDLESWQAAQLPEGATAARTVSGSYAGVDATVTTYDDPGYVTVEAYGQSITLAVPSSAQSALTLLSYVQ